MDFAKDKTNRTFVTQNEKNQRGFQPILEFSPYFNTIKKIIMAAIYMTKEGQQKKLDELNYLENVERPKVIQQISDARDKGDLSENAEYDAAKEAQGKLEAKIAELKGILANVKIIDESKIDKSKVGLLTKVTIKNVKTGQEMTYTIVSENEANLKEHKISISTPIAQGLKDHKKGETVDVTTPRGTMQFEIIDITI